MHGHWRYTMHVCLCLAARCCVLMTAVCVAAKCFKRTVDCLLCSCCCCCCCHYCSTAALEKDVVVAQLQAQAAAIAQEREALSMQRINTDVLANLSEQVGHCVQ
jgi:hypothetical protein